MLRRPKISEAAANRWLPALLYSEPRWQEPRHGHSSLATLTHSFTFLWPFTMVVSHDSYTHDSLRIWPHKACNTEEIFPASEQRLCGSVWCGSAFSHLDTWQPIRRQARPSAVSRYGHTGQIPTSLEAALCLSQQAVHPAAEKQEVLHKQWKETNAAMNIATPITTGRAGPRTSVRLLSHPDHLQRLAPKETRSS